VANLHPQEKIRHKGVHVMLIYTIDAITNDTDTVTTERQDLETFTLV
jgi:hypothetical protein